MGAFFFWKKPQLKGRVSILIPTFKDSRYVIELCLKSIKKHTDYPDYQIIVCDAGADQETRNFLSERERCGEIKIIKATDPERPKDDLVAAVDTEYYMIMHDDIRILHHSWLRRRLQLIQTDVKNAIVGTIVRNYDNTKRFFPLGLLVRTSVSQELGLKWGKLLEKRLDTGAAAYRKFLSQNKYKFIPYKVSRDIYHFSSMGWPLNKNGTDPFIAQKLQQREQKIKMIRQMLEKEDY